jgi:hypothetical protein
VGKSNHIYTNFSSGEVSPKLFGRPDYSKYQNSCETLENFMLEPLGGATRRAGTEYIATTKFPQYSCRLIPFVFSDEQAYMLEVGQYYIRFFMDGGVITQGTEPIEVVTPYASADVFGIQYVQSCDVMYFTHRSFPVYKLSRTSHTVWTFEAVDWIDGPYREVNDNKSLHIQSSATTGSTTLSGATHPVPVGGGPWGYTAASNIPVLTGTIHQAAFRFHATMTGVLSRVDIEQPTDPADAIGGTCACELHNDNSNAIGTLIAYADQELSIAYSGVKEFTFNGASITSGKYYWVVFTLNGPSPDVVFSGVTADGFTSYTGADGTLNLLADHLNFKLYYECQCVTVEDVNLWNVGHVGSLWRLRTTGQSVTGYFDNAYAQFGGTVNLYGRFTVDLSPYQLIGADPANYPVSDPNKPWVGQVVLEKSYDGGVSFLEVASFWYSTKQEFFETEPNVWYRLRLANYTSGICIVTIAQDERWGVIKITGYTSPSIVTGTVLVPLGNTLPTAEWREGAWSTYRGFPRCATFHENRLWFAGNDSQPDTLWASWTGDYENFEPEGDTDDSALSFTLLSGTSNAIQWMQPYRGIGIGTLEGEWLLTGESSGKPITSKSVNVAKHSTHGSAKDIMPIRVGAVVLFVQRDRRTVRELVYSFDTDSLVAPNLCQLAQHITLSGVKAIAFQEMPSPVLWCVLDSGYIAALAYNRKEEIVGWCSEKTEGAFESVAVIPSSPGDVEGSDEVWCIVARTINGSLVSYVERLKNNTDTVLHPDFWYVDSGLQYDGVSTTAITGLSHLVGRTVSVLGDGLVLNDKVVSPTGGITLERSCSKVTAGLRFISTLKTMPLDLPMQGGSMQGIVSRINRVILRLYRTLGGKCGSTVATLTKLPQRAPGMSMDEPIPLVSWDSILPFPDDPTRGYNQIIVVQDQPLPMTVLSLIARVNVYDQ